MLFCHDSMKVYTSGTKFSGFYGTPPFKVIYCNANVLLFILVSIKWNQYKDTHWVPG